MTPFAARSRCRADPPRGRPETPPEPETAASSAALDEELSRLPPPPRHPGDGPEFSRESGPAGTALAWFMASFIASSIASSIAASIAASFAASLASF